MATRSDTDELSADLYALISYLHARCNADLLDTIDELGLTATQVKLLHRLQHAQRAPTITQCAAIAHVGRQHATRITSELVDRGLIERLADGRDGRSQRVRLTPEGQAAIRELSRTRHGHCTRLVNQLEPDERADLRAALARVVARDQIAAHRPEY